MTKRLPTDDSMMSGTMPVVETVRKGTAAAPGIAIGRAFLMDRRRLKVPKRYILADELDAEIERFHRALDASDRQLERIKEKIEARFDDHYNIITAHQLILHDEHLVDETVRNIRDRGVNAEWALRKTVEHIRGVFDSIEDDYFRERRSDVEFVGERVLRNLMGRDLLVTPPPDAIVVAYDLSPADTAQFYRAAVAGLATDAGGNTSHTAIIARAHEIPAVVGLDDITAVVGNGDLIVIDGTSGVVVLNPSPETVGLYRERARQEAAQGVALLSNVELPATSTDDVRISLVANIDHEDEIRGAIAYGAEGVGLFRTEFLYLTGGRVPDENDQFRHACSVIESLGGKPVTFRTMDLGADKMAVFMPEMHEANPALGLRSIRLCLTTQVRPLFKQQLRGLLRAAESGNMRIMFPMISGVRELELALEVLAEVKDEMVRDGISFKQDTKVGIMIEMPSAAMVADHLARRVDFFSIGTNDLIQYTLAVDRVNEHVAYLYDSMHPALLRLIDMVVKAAEAAGIPVGLCGEMAGDVNVVPLLLGLGLTELSTNAVAIPLVKQLIRGATVHELREMASEALNLPSGPDVKELVWNHMQRLPGANPKGSPPR
ncbi:MAG TPA: phosphoenolpyruvate--protein phosphotransferase [Kofleriaceae bacterium]|nr:phosphoenolpyruvate--protein phosphotransferase [Kofleriaceae bacterium]